MPPGLAISPLLLATCVMPQMMLCFVSPVHSWCPRPSETKFVQRTNKFWEFEEQRNTWVEISLPYDLISCVDDNCSKVASIVDMDQKQAGLASQDKQQDKQEDHDAALPLRRRISLTRMSEASVWVTGQSGSIFERFWNGVKWVIAPHELPSPTSRATSVFIVNQTILALSEAGQLYQVLFHAPPETLFVLSILFYKPYPVNFHSSRDFSCNWMRILSRFGSSLCLRLKKVEELKRSQVQMFRSSLVLYPMMESKNIYAFFSNYNLCGDTFSCLYFRRLYLSTVTGTLLEISEFHPLRYGTTQSQEAMQ